MGRRQSNKTAAEFCVSQGSDLLKVGEATCCNRRSGDHSERAAIMGDLYAEVGVSLGAALLPRVMVEGHHRVGYLRGSSFPPLAGEAVIHP